jgi:hypothetical protein
VGAREGGQAAAGLSPPQMGFFRDESGRVHLNIGRSRESVYLCGFCRVATLIRCDSDALRRRKSRIEWESIQH